MLANLGLALSGGGSRAAAFHRGTLEAISELGLIERVDVVSTVSGGSLFGGTWLAARSDGTTDADFVAAMKEQLEKGFIGRTVMRPWRLVKALTPFTRYSRTNAISQTFDEIFFDGKTLDALPKTPKLCINTTIMNNGQVGKFSREGFSAWDLRQPRVQDPKQSTHHIRWGDFPLALAVTASAAFPVGLPPVAIRRKDFPADVEFIGALKDAGTVSLTDGGVLENLGIQSLLASRRFGCWDMIVSDAGTRAQPWSENSVWNSVRGFGVWVASGRILDRIMSIMNDKENRWARQHVIEEMQASWMAEELRDGQFGSAMKLLLAARPSRPRRNVLFVRVAQNWRTLLKSLPRTRLVELNGGSETGVPDPGDPGTRPEDVEKFLQQVGVDLTRALEWYQRLKGDAGAKAANSVPTNFTGLDGDTLDQLAAHAAWQVHANHAIYGI